jgi:mRNA-degrading endonuclease toxin of MazEF toxin-antitoxin module
MNVGDIVLAPFHFMENEQSKLRPCLVFSIDAISVNLVYISSQKLSQAFAYEVVLTEAESKQIGLEKRSRIDFSKRDRVPVAEIKKVLGNIQALPKARLAECFSSARAAGLYD